MLLVTGATGFIGSHLVDRLCAIYESVRCLVRSKTRPRSIPEDAEVVRADVLNGDALEQAFRGVRVVVHLAGVTKALNSSDYYTGNVLLTEKLARSAAVRGLPFIHVSSLAAAGPSPDGQPLDESEPPRPVSEYGKSKLMAEQTVRTILPSAVIVRPPVVYGPRDTDVFQFLKSVNQGKILEIAGGERWFSAIYVADLVAGLIELARTSAGRGRTYYLAHPKPLSWNEFGAVAARIMGRQAKTVRVPLWAASAMAELSSLGARFTRKPGILSPDKIAEARCPYWTCSSARAATDLNFQASTSIEDGLTKTLQWYKEAGWLRY